MGVRENASLSLTPCLLVVGVVVVVVVVVGILEDVPENASLSLTSLHVALVGEIGDGVVVVVVVVEGSKIPSQKRNSQPQIDSQSHHPLQGNRQEDHTCQ